MVDTADDGLQAARAKVEGLMGHCILQLQRYEIGLKALLSVSDLTVTQGPPGADPAVQGADTTGKTLGQLVGLFTAEHLADIDAPKEDDWSKADKADATFRWRLGMTGADLARVTQDLRDLVDLRNTLVHHFLDQHDCKTLDGCRAAIDALRADSDRIAAHLAVLKGWVLSRQKAGTAAAMALSAPDLQEAAINGILPDGTVVWPAAGILFSLRRAAHELARDGWTDLNAAAKLIAASEPGQTPERYGCASWEDVLRVSGMFRLRRGRNRQITPEAGGSVTVKFSVIVEK